MTISQRHQPPPCREIGPSDIRTVQHLIETCLTFYMDRDECVDALHRYANIRPVITITVWKELEKANTDFFVEYSRRRNARCVHVFKDTINEVISNLCVRYLNDPNTAQADCS